MHRSSLPKPRDFAARLVRMVALACGLLLLGGMPALAQIDTDGDGLIDSEEISLYGTDPMNPDTDGDTLTDADEILVHGTSAIEWDTDSDTWHDGVEVSASSDPLVRSDDPLPAGLVGYWKFDGDYADSSASAIDGEARGRAHPHALGVDGNCATFHGPGDAVSLGTPGALNEALTQTTVAAWVFLDRYSSHSYVFSNDGEGAGPYHGYALAASLSNDLPAFRVWNGTSVAVVEAAEPLALDQWHHLVGTYDGVTLNLYVDGELSGSLVYSGGIGNPASFEARIGSLGERDTFEQSIHGMIDEVMVFNTALGSTEIDELYEYYEPTPGPTDPPAPNTAPIPLEPQQIEDIATTIRLESIRPNVNVWGKPLPLVAHWNVKYNKNDLIEKHGMDPFRQLDLIKAGYPLLLTFETPLPYNEATFPIAYRPLFEEAEVLQLPIAFRTTQWEQLLYGEQNSDETFGLLDLAPLESPNVIKRHDPPILGEPEFYVWLTQRRSTSPFLPVISPFGAVEPWRTAGGLWGGTNPLQEVQSWYLSPPKVLFFSNNEAKKLTASLIDESCRYLDLLASQGADPVDIDGETKRTMIEAGWAERYPAFFEGFRNALVEPTWRENVRFGGYNAFGPSGMGRRPTWSTNSRMTTDHIDTSSLYWNAASVAAYVGPGNGSTDYKVWCPQITSMNRVFMQREALESNPEFWYEQLSWDGGWKQRAFYAITEQPLETLGLTQADLDGIGLSELQLNGRLSNEQLAALQDLGLTNSMLEAAFSPQRYGGTNQFVLWLLRPRVLRHFRGSSEIRVDFEKYWWPSVEAVNRIHHNYILKLFWRHGQLVANLNPHPGQNTHPGQPFGHPFDKNIPEKYQNETRWFMLDTNLDPQHPYYYGDSGLGYRPFHDWPEIPVFSLAYLIGEKPNRQWLVYAHSPLQKREAVEITIPDYGPIVVDVPVGGAFYHVYESGLLAHWEFDEEDGTHAADSSGNGHDGLLVNEAAFGFDRKVGAHALSLDGVDDYVDAGEISLGNQFTLTAWAKLAPDHNNIQTLIANTSSGLASDGFKLFVNSWGTTNQKVFFETGNGSTGSQAKTDVGVFPFDQWNHVAVVVDRPAGTATIYVNGSDASFARTTQTDFRVDGRVTIGQMNGQLPFTGSIDDVRIYTRKLTAPQIAELAAAIGPTAPTPPNGFVALLGNDGQANLFWSDNSDNEDAFEIERRIDDGPFTQLFSVSTNVTSAIDDSDLLDATTYTYRVRATNIAGSSGYSNDYALTLLGAPTGLIATTVGDTQINLSWQDNSENEGVFVIMRKIDDGDFAFYRTVAANTTSYSDTDLDAGTTYTYRVRASRPALGLLSAFSNEASATPGVPAAPSDLVATAVSDSQIDLSWSDNSDNEVVFVIAQKIGDGVFNFLATVSPDTTSYGVSGLDPSTTYTYRVRANGGALGLSDFSNEASATTAAPSGGLDVGLVGYWLFDDDNATIVADASGNSHDATLVNGATLVDADHGQGGRALSLDGQNDYADVGAISLGDTFTIAFRAKRTGGFTSTRTLVANGPMGFGPDGFKIFFNSWNTSDQRVVFETGNGSSGAQAKSVENVLSSGNWDHIAVVVDRAGGVASIYVNGIDRTDPSRNTVLTDFGVDASVNIGQMIGGSLHFKGHVDDVRIYNRLLTDADILTLANAEG